MSVYKLRKAIDERFRQSHGIGYAGVILGVALAGFVLFPITKWFLNINSGTNDLSKKLEMQSVIQDYWQSLNAMTYDEFEAAVASRGTTFSEDIGNWKVTTTFSAKGKYANSTCSPGTTPTADDRSCRRATITIQNKNDTLQSTKLDTTKVSSQSDKRIRDLEARATSLESRASTSESNISSLKTRVTNAENKFGSYYTASQVNSVLGGYYTKSQVDTKVSSGGVVKITQGVQGLNWGRNWRANGRDQTPLTAKQWCEGYDYQITDPSWFNPRKDSVLNRRMEYTHTRLICQHAARGEYIETCNNSYCSYICSNGCYVYADWEEDFGPGS